MRNKRKSMFDKNKRISERFARGTLYQARPGGNFYYRYQVNGIRRSTSLKTSDFQLAKKKVTENIIPIISTTSTEVIAAHVKQAKSMSELAKEKLALVDVWEKYSKHPDRAMPATVSEQLAYKSTFKEFAKRILKKKKNIRIDEITHNHALDFSEYLKTTQIAVDTHNRKIKRLRKIFRVLHEYRGDTQCPFASATLLRKNREEQNLEIRRLAFTREQERKLLEVLDDPSKKVIHKAEIKIIFYLGMFTGQRLKDCVLLRWNRVDFQRRTIEVKQFKTGKEVSIPIAPQLNKVLQEAMQWKENDFDYICPNVAERYNRFDERGKNIGNNLVNKDILRVITWTGLQTSVKVPGRKKAITVYGFHSLRHSFASHCAIANVPKAVVLSILGADSEIVDKYYTHVGEEAQHKAMVAIAGKIGILSAQDKIERTLAHIATLENSEDLEEIKRLLTEN